MHNVELEVTWKRAILVWWSYFWRYLLFTFLCSIAGIVVLVCLSIAGVKDPRVVWVLSIFGVVLGPITAILPFKMILGKDFGKFRLVLLNKRIDPYPPDKSIY